MNRRTWLTTVGTAATVGLAGCTGSEDAEPTDEDEEDDSDPSLETFEFPEYASADGIEAAELTSAHFDRIRDEGSVTVSQWTESTFESHSSEQETEARISTDGILTTETGEETTTVWTEHGTNRGLIQRDFGFQTVYQITVDSIREQEALFERNITGLSERAEFGEALSAVEIDGTLTARYDVTGVTEPQSNSRSVIGSEDITDVSGSIFVTESGVVKRVEYDLTYQFDRMEQGEATEVTYSDIGSTTATEPDWAETARNEGRAFETTVTDDGYLSFELVNGDLIPQGTSVSISLPGGHGRATLPADVTVDSRIIAAVSNGDVSVSVDEQPASESNFDGDYVHIALRHDGQALYEEDFSFFDR